MSGAMQQERTGYTLKIMILNIPNHFAEMISMYIIRMLKERNIIVPEFSDYVDSNKELGTTEGLSFALKQRFLTKVFSKKKQVVL